MRTIRTKNQVLAWQENWGFYVLKGSISQLKNYQRQTSHKSEISSKLKEVIKTLQELEHLITLSQLERMTKKEVGLNDDPR